MNWNYKEYPCIEEGCGRTFNTRWTLKRHCATHRLTDNPIYNCNKCDKNFSRKDSLDRHHQMCHSSIIMMYICSEDGCGKFFGMKSTLYRHMSSHTGSYQCQACSRNFSRKDNLARHQNIHTKKQLTKCEEAVQQKQVNSNGCPKEDSRNTINPTDNTYLDFNDRKGDHDHTYALLAG